MAGDFGDLALSGSLFRGAERAIGLLRHCQTMAATRAGGCPRTNMSARCVRQGRTPNTQQQE